MRQTPGLALLVACADTVPSMCRNCFVTAQTIHDVDQRAQSESGKPSITAKKCFAVKYLPRNACIGKRQQGLDGVTKNVDNHPPAAPGGLI